MLQESWIHVYLYMKTSQPLTVIKHQRSTKKRKSYCRIHDGKRKLFLSGRSRCLRSPNWDRFCATHQWWLIHLQLPICWLLCQFIMIIVVIFIFVIPSVSFFPPFLLPVFSIGIHFIISLSSRLGTFYNEKPNLYCLLTHLHLHLLRRLIITYCIFCLLYASLSQQIERPQDVPPKTYEI